jgi:gas vesicle protein
MRTTHENGFTYLVIGIGLGLLAGLLWAPRRGQEMREELRRGADTGLDYLTEEAEKLRTEADRWFGKLKERWSSKLRGRSQHGNSFGTAE